MTSLFTCMMDIETLILEESESSGDDYDGYPEATCPDEADMFGAAGYATYNDFASNSVYAESLVSAADARRLVLDKCRELKDKFAAAVEKMTQGE